jgi:AcrR family transcriptional regulator
MRKTQEERRRTTQAAVLSAALDVLIDDGFANFSAGRVAARAGVSRGALERYFPTKNDLLVAATQHAMDEAVAHAREMSARNSKPTVERFLLDSEHFFFSPLYRAMLELAIAAASDSTLGKLHRPIVARARKSLNGIWLDTLIAAGFPPDRAERFILLTHYMLRGLFVVDAWLPYDSDRKAVVQQWASLAPLMLNSQSPRARRPTRGKRPLKRSRR